MIYLVDANTFIQAKNFYYRMHFCPGYWDWLDKVFADNNVCSIDQVYRELKEGGDELSDWVAVRRDFFLPVDDEDTQLQFADIANHIGNHGTMREPHTSTFLGGADPWLIAKAITTGATLVTH